MEYLSNDEQEKNLPNQEELPSFMPSSDTSMIMPLSINSPESLENGTSTNSHVLPPGWRAIQHLSGLVMYIHDATSVACWTKPYVCPKSIDLEKHCPPLSTFDPTFNPLKAEEVNTNPWHAHKSLWAKCTEAFNSSEMWKKRPRLKEVNHLGNEMSLTESTDKNFPSLHFEKNHQENIVINGVEIPKPDCKSAITFLQDYSMKVLKCTPKYLQKQIGESSFAYTIYLEGMEYGSGEDSTKKSARIRAAENTLEILIPGVWKGILEKGVLEKESDTSHQEKQNAQHLQCFRMLEIQDPRVLQACAELNIKTPAQLLQEYQNRNSGLVVNYEAEKEPTGEFSPTGLPVYQFRLTATVGNKVAKAIGTTKKQAKQFASQSLLSKLHPSDHYYYKVVERYGPRETSSLSTEYGKVKSFSTSRQTRHRDSLPYVSFRSSERRKSESYKSNRDLYKKKKYPATRRTSYSRSHSTSQRSSGHHEEATSKTNSKTKSKTNSKTNSKINSKTNSKTKEYSPQRSGRSDPSDASSAKTTKTTQDYVKPSHILLLGDLKDDQKNLPGHRAA